MRDFVKKYKYLFISLGIVSFVFSYFIFFNDSIFIFAGDGYEQQYKFYIEAWHRLRDGSLSFWDWSNFLGNNYYGASTFYFLGSPFFWIDMLLPNPELIQYSFLYLTILKSILCVIFCYIWLNKIKNNDLAASLGALIVTFSGFVFSNYCNFHIFDPILFIPVCLYFVECFLQDNKSLGLSLSIGYLGILNYYFLYLFVPFSCIYALVRYLTISKDHSIKSTLKIGCVYVFRVILGILVSCVVLYPSFIALQGNSRTESLLTSSIFVGKLTYFRFLTSFISPICDWRLNYNSFISANINPGVGWGGGYANYSLIISVYCTILVLFIKNKKEKYSCISLLFIYCFFALFPFFYILFNQNYESRWMYVFTFIFAYIVFITINNIKDLSIKNYLISGIILVLIIWSCYLITNKFGLNDVVWELRFLKRNCIFITIIVALYMFLFSASCKRNILGLVIIIIFAEIVFNTYSGIYGVKNEIYEPMTKEILDKNNTSYKDAAKLIIEEDESFYRIDKDKLYDNLGGNDIHLQRYKSFYGYHSLYNYNQTDFIDPRFTPYWIFKPQTGKDILKSMLGCKYWFSYNKEKDYPVPYGYTYYDKSNDQGVIFVNDYPITFGYLRDKEISKEDFDSFDILHQDYLLLDHVVLENANYSDKTNYIELKNVLNKIESEKFDIQNKEGYFYIVFPKTEYRLAHYSVPNWHLFDINNNELYSNALSGEYGYVGINISNENYSFLDLRHVSRSEVYYDDMSWYEDWYNSQEMVDPDSVKWDDNSISGNITVSKDGYFVSSVPYDKGWTVKLDGKKINYLKVNEGFVGFEISKGTHTVEMTYVPPGLIVGSITSVLSLILCFILEKKRKVL